MTPNLEARRVGVVASEDPYADGTVYLSLKWTVGSPWVVLCQVADINPGNTWNSDNIASSRSLVFSFGDILAIDTIWAMRRLRERFSTRTV